VTDPLPRILFVTGTDTGVGKTLVAAAILRGAEAAGMRTAAVKPVAAGCDSDGGQLVNADAELLRSTATVRRDYAEVNPVALEPAVAPHLAAEQSGIRLHAAGLVSHCLNAARDDIDVLVVEGAGGWLVPLNDGETLADVGAALEASVVLVIGMRLGCLNHALLTASAVRSAGVTLAGWVANCIDPDMALLDENIGTLRDWLPAPCLGVVPYFDGPDPRVVAGLLDLSTLFQSP